MSTSLDRKIEAAKLRAEAERKHAGGPAAPEEVAAFESLGAATADQSNMQTRNLLDKMPFAKPLEGLVCAADLDPARFAALWNDGADAPMMATSEYRALMAAEIPLPLISRRRRDDAGKMTQCEKTLREIVCPPHDAPLFRPLMGDACADLPPGNEAEMKRREETLREMPPPPHGDPLFQRRAAPPDADALRESVRRAASGAGGSERSAKESTLKTIEPLIREIAILRDEVWRLQQECRALRFGDSAHFQGAELRG